MGWKLTLFLGVLLLPTTIAAQDAEDEDRIEMRAENQDFDFYFRVEGIEGRNPSLGLRPGSNITIVVRNEGTTIHNLHFDTGDRSRLLDPQEEDRFVLRVPHDVDPQSLLYYWCDPHRDLGMIGTTRVATDLGDVSRSQTNESGGPGSGVLIVLLGLTTSLIRRMG